MTETTDGVRDARRARHHAIRAEVAQEESEAAEADVADRRGACPDLVESIAREELRRG